MIPAAARPKTFRRFALKPLPLALLLAVSAPAFSQGLTGIQDTRGVTVQQAGGVTHLYANGKAGFVQADGFGLGATESAVVHGGANFHTLIAVTGNTASVIDGRIFSAGNFWVSNPNGVLVGREAQIDVGGFMGTTLSLSREDFLSGRYQFSATPGQGPYAGRVINKGRITAHGGGDIVLMGQQVANEGTLSAQGGRVGMLAAEEVLVDVEGDGLLFFNVKASDAQVRLSQLGRIEADGGSVELMAAARGQFADTVLNMDGVVQARGLGVREGRVVIDGGTSGATVVSGHIDVSGQDAGQHGGSVAVLGEKVALVGQARIDARGNDGGGTVLIGGDVQGQGSTRRAQRTYVGKDAVIDASATGRGDGGTVVVWADGDTRYHGHIDAKGGALGGHGGFTEVSGHEHLAFRGTVDLSAPLGAKGQLLLDPRNINIVASAGSADANGDGTTGDDLSGPVFDAGGGLNSSVSTLSVPALLAQLDLADVTLSADNDITVSAAIDASANTGSHRLTLQAGNDSGDRIVLNASITTRGGLTLTGTAINVNADVVLDGGTGTVVINNTVNGNGNDLTLRSSASGDAITLNAANGIGTLTAEGNLRINGNITSTGSVSATAAAALAANVQTTGDQVWSGPLRVIGSSATRTLSASAGSIDLATVVGNGNSLTVSAGGASGVATLGGAVTDMATLNTTGSTTTAINADVSATTQTYGAATLGGAGAQVTLAGTNVTMGAVGSASGQNLVINASGVATLGGVVANTVGSVNTAGSTSTAINANVNAGTQNYGAATLGGAGTGVTLTGNTVTLAGVTGGGKNLAVSATTQATLGGTVSGVAALNASGSAATAIHANVTTTGAQSYGAATLGGSGTTRTLTGNGVGFSGAVSGGGKNLTVAGGGLLTLGGGASNIGALVASATSGTAVGGDVTTTGAQTYGGTVTLGADAAFRGTALTFNNIAAAGHAVGLRADAVTVSGTATGGAGSTATFEPLSNNGTISVAGGAPVAAGTLQISQALLAKFSGFDSITIGSAVNPYTVNMGNVVLPTRTLIRSSSGNVALRTVNGARDLEVQTTGTIALNDVIGGTDALRSLTLDGGAITINTTSVKTTDGQAYNGNVTLAQNTVLDNSGTGVVSFDGTVDGARTLEIDGDARFGGNVGNGTALTSLNVSGDTQLEGVTVRTTGAQVYAGAMTLSGATTMLQALSVRLGGTTDGQAAGAQALQIVAGSVEIDGAVGGGTALQSLAITGDTTLGASVRTSAQQSYDGAVVLDGNATLTSTSGTVTFSDNVDGAHTLTVSTLGGVTFGGAVGGTTALAGLDITAGAAAVNGGAVTTSGDQSYAAGVTLGAGTTFRGDALSFAGGLSAGAHALNFRLGSSLSAGGAITGTGTVSIAARTDATDISLGAATAAAGDLEILGGTLSLFGSGFASLTVGSATGSGTVTVAPLTLTRDLGVVTGTGDIVVSGVQTAVDGLHAFTATSTSGTVTIGDIGTGVARLASLDVSGGQIRLDASQIRTTGAQRFMGAVTLLRDVYAQGGTVRFGATVNGAFILEAQATGGSVRFDGAVGGTTPLSQLWVYSPSLIAGSIRTLGQQYYGGLATLGADATFEAGALTLTNGLSAGAHALGLLTDSLSVSGLLSGTGTVQVAPATVGRAIVVAPGSGFTPAGELVVDSATFSMLSTFSSVTVGRADGTGAITVGGTGESFSLPNNLTLLSGTGDITLQSAIDGPFSLSLLTDGITTIAGPVGATTALASLTTDADGTTRLANTVRTTGTQTYGDDVMLQSSASLTGTVRFEGDVDGSTAGGQSLSVGGNASFGGHVGGGTRLAAVSVSGSTRFEGGTVHTSSLQQYQGPVTLAGDVTTTSDASYVYFASTVDGAHALSSTSGSGTYFGGAVGGGTALSSVTTAGGGTILYTGNGSVTTTGNQSYTALTLTADATLTGQAISLNGGASGAHALNIVNSGTATLAGAFNTGATLAGLTTTGATAINTSAITTTGAQRYGGAVTLGTGTVLTATQTGADVAFQSTVDGAHALTVTASGTTTFTGHVGAVTPLASLTTNGGGGTVLPATVTTTGAQNYLDAVTLSANTALTANGVSMGDLLGAGRSLQIASTGLVDLNGSIANLAGLTTTGGGTVRFDGSAGLSTTGAQSYSGDVIVSLDGAVFSASSLTFSQDLTAGSGLTLVADALSLGGTVSGSGIFTLQGRAAATTIGLNGGAGALALDLADLAGFSRQVVGRTDGSGAVTMGTATLARDTVLQNGTGAITLNGAVDGPVNLVLNTGGTTTIAGPVGGTSALASLSTNAGGSTVLTATTVRTTGAQAYGDAVTYGNAPTTLSGSTLGFAAGIGGGTDLTLQADSLSVDSGTVSGSGTLTLQPTAAGTTIGLAGGAGTLQIGTALLDRITGFNRLVIGRTDGTAAISSGALALALARDLTIRSATGAIAFSGTVNGPHDLVVNTGGATSFAADVGTTTALASLTTDAGGSTSFAGTQVVTSGDQSYGDAVTYGTTTFSADHLAFSQGATGGTHLTLEANTLSVSGALSGTGVLSIRPRNAGGTMGLGGAAGTLQITQALLNQASGFTQHVLGRTDGTGAVMADALTLTGNTVLQSGTGDITLGTLDGAHSLEVNTAGTTLFAGNVGDTTRLTSLRTDAAGSTALSAARVRTSGNITLADRVHATVDVALDAGSGGDIDLADMNNLFVGTVGLTARSVRLNAGVGLTLGKVSLVEGGTISAGGVLTLSDDIDLSGPAGTLTLISRATPSTVGFTEAELAERPRIFNSLTLQEQSAVVRQTGGRINTAAGSLLSVEATAGGSISLEQAGNTINGQVSAVTAPVGSPDFSGSGTRALGFVRLASTNVAVGGNGIQADAVKITADRLSTAPGTSIRARLPYNNLQGIEAALPALTLVLSPTALGTPASSKPFGGLGESERVQVDLGDATFGGFLTVRPKGGGTLSNAFVSLGGPSASPRPFYDGSGKLTEIQVFYNGEVPQSPQEIGALSAVSAVIEESRRQRFEEAVRTENVSLRLRSGVIAEVGAGRPATEGSESIRLPESCTPSGTTLACP